MNTAQKLSTQELQVLGGGVLGYVREIAAKEAKTMLGAQFGEGMIIPPQAKLYCLYNADGTPISISGSREAAIGSALEHDLMPASVH
jgi:hypothetical protein